MLLLIKKLNVVQNMLMKKFIFLSIVTAFFACEKPAVIDYMLFSGKIKNSESDKLIVVGKDFKQEIVINAEGSFSDTLNLDNNGYYSFYIERESSALYLTKGADLNLTIDVKEFDESILYAGSIGAENNVLAKSYMINEVTLGETADFYAKEEATFLATSKEAKEKVETLIKSSKTNEAFKKEQIENAGYEYAITLMQYERYHAHFAKIEDFKVSNTFNNNQIEFVTNDEAAYKSSSSYRDLVSNVFDEEVNNAYDKDKEYIDVLISVAGKVENNYIKEELIKSNSGQMLGVGESLQKAYDYLMANSTNEAYKEEYTESYEKLKLLAKGMPSPSFENYENHKGGTTSLTDLKGKYTYIDVWATWCGPCLREIPSLKAVEEQFREKNIQFVSASIDRAKDYDTWVSMVNDKELTGIQLMADNDWSSQFAKDYQINGIPRFILVDPEGNIVSADAPRPSDPKLKELFADLNI
jgi:thiol-disulfide isomerase/thioredoxin